MLYCLFERRGFCHCGSAGKAACDRDAELWPTLINIQSMILVIDDPAVTHKHTHTGHAPHHHSSAEFSNKQAQYVQNIFKLYPNKCQEIGRITQQFHRDRISDIMTRNLLYLQLDIRFQFKNNPGKTEKLQIRSL